MKTVVLTREVIGREARPPTIARGAQSSPLGMKIAWPVLAALLLVYGRPLAQLVTDWWKNPDYSHGLIIPFVIFFLVRQKMPSLRSIALRPNNFGLLVILGSQVIFLLGYLGAEFFLQRVSLLLLVAGVLLFLAGWRYLREMSFVLTLFLLAIPLPAIIFNSVAVFLQLIASSWAESILSFVGIPVYREGNVLQLAFQTLNVTEACSGIRSLVSLLTLAMILAYFLRAKFPWRAALVATSIPVAIVANSLRVAGTAILARSFGERAASGFFHLFSGWVVFVFAFLFLLGESFLLQRWLGRESGMEKQS